MDWEGEEEEEEQRREAKAAAKRRKKGRDSGEPGDGGGVGASLGRAK